MNDINVQQRIGYYTVWVSTAVKPGLHKWPGTSGWTRANHVVPQTYSDRGFGIASFVIKRPHNATTILPTSEPATISLEATQWICICVAPKEADSKPTNANTIQWIGRIKTIEAVAVKGSGDTNGSILANGPAAMFYETYLSGFVDTDGAIDTPPGFNFLEGDIVVGNFHKTDKDASVGVFTRNPASFVRSKSFETTTVDFQQTQWPSTAGSSNDAEVAKGAWNRLRVINYILSNCIPLNFPVARGALQPVSNSSSLPALKANSKGVIDILNGKRPEAWNFDSNTTLGGALDLLIPKSMGLSWDVYLTESGPLAIHVFSHSPVTIRDLSGHDTALSRNIGVSVTASNNLVKELSLIDHDTRDRVDKLVVEGDRIVCCGTALGPAFTDASTSAYDSNPATTKAQLKSAWGRTKSTSNEDPEYLYVTGQQGTDGKVLQTASEQDNATWRGQPGLGDVFQLFEISGTFYGKYGIWTRFPAIYEQKYSQSKVIKPGAQGDRLAFFPRFTWDPVQANVADQLKAADIIEADGKASTSLATNHASPNPVMAKILTWIPWEISTAYTDSQAATSQNVVSKDYRTNEEKASPKYDTPRIYEYNGFGWVDRMNMSTGLRPGIIPQPFMRVRIEHDNPQIIASNEWKYYADHDQNGASKTDPLEDDDRGNWRYFAFTYAAESDQRVQVTMYHPTLLAEANGSKQLADSISRNVLRITNQDLKCYFIGKGTLIGGIHPPLVRDTLIGNITNVPQQTDHNIFTRNDFPTAQRICEQIAAWVFRSRATASITLARPDLLPPYTLNVIPGTAADRTKAKTDPDQEATAVAAEEAADPYPNWAYIGCMLGKVIDGTVEHAVNTVVQNVQVNLDSAMPFAVVSTMMPETPNFASGALLSNSGGAQIPSLGGTLVQTVKKIKDDQTKMKARVNEIPTTFKQQSLAPLEGGLALVLASCYGGNALPVAYTNNDLTKPLYPTSLPMSLPISGITIKIPKWDDDKHKLAEDFKHGDNVNRLEDGLAWFRLLKDSDKVGAIAWDADQPVALPTTTTAGTAPVLKQAYTQPKDKKKITIIFDQLLNVDNTGTLDVTQFTIANPVNTVTAVNVDKLAAGQITLTLENDIVATTTTLTCPGIVANDHNDRSEPIKDSVIEYLQDKNCYIMCINIMGYRAFKNGDVVMLDLNKSIKLVDDLGVARSLYVVTPIDSSQMPHRHINEGSGVLGGGYAFLSPAPLSSARYYESGWG